jgi:hypothetical protein
MFEGVDFIGKLCLDGADGFRELLKHTHDKLVSPLHTNSIV